MANGAGLEPAPAVLETAALPVELPEEMPLGYAVGLPIPPEAIEVPREPFGCITLRSSVRVRRRRDLCNGRGWAKLALAFS